MDWGIKFVGGFCMRELALILLSVSLLVGCKQAGVVERGSVGTIDDTQNIGTSIQPPLINLEPENLDLPVVQILNSEMNYLEGFDIDIEYRVIPGQRPLANIRCKVDSLVQLCALSGGVITVRAPAIGPHILEILVADTSERAIRKEWAFTVHDRIQRTRQQIQVNPGEKAKADILFVIDNSKSMEEEQDYISDRILSFMDVLKDLDWRLAITTTDAREQFSFGDGALQAFEPGRYFLDSNMESKRAKELFGQTAQRSEDGSPFERGLRASYRTIERFSAVGDPAQSFFRDTASLAVVIISDEDETRLQSSGQPWEDGYRSDASNFFRLVKETWSSEKLVQFNSIITRPGDEQCLQPNGSGWSYGHVYQEISDLTGGVTGDICASDFGVELAQIGQGVSDLERTYELDCHPQDLGSTGSIDFRVVSLDGNEVPAYSLNGNQVKFEENLEPGRYDFVYFCLATVSP